MSRVVDCFPSSDDELPEANASSLNRPPLTAKHPRVANLLPPKDLVPKSTSKPRRVRRLDGGAVGSGNVLLQKFNSSQDPESPRRSPTKRALFRKDESTLQPSIFDDDAVLDVSPTKRGASSREPSIIQPSIFDEEDAPPATVRPARFRRVKPIHNLGVDLESADEDSQSSLQSIRLTQDQSVGADTSRESEEPSNAGLRDSSLELSLEVDKADETEQNLVDAQLADEFNAISLSDKDGFEGKSISEQPSFSHSFQSFGDLDSQSGNESSSTASPDNSSLDQVPESPTGPFATRLFKTKGAASIEVSKKPKSILSTRNPDLLNHQATPRPGESKNRLTTSLFRPSTRPRGTEDVAEKVSSLNLANELSKLRLDFCEPSDQENGRENGILPETPVKTRKTKRMVSLTKTPGFPKTPHRPNDDAFWNQEIVNDWIDEHSPRKPTMPASSISNAKRSPSKDEKRNFEAKKHTIASDFLQELDNKITEGKIGQLAEATGGVTLVWSKTLNTTAGRANWRRETIRTKDASGAETSVQHKHHASIELAEKVINDEDRLLNVVAHEFCHLANFMISGVTNNPHGKEFKAWASQCSQVFGSRGIKVTTKHTYDINYKYVWECVSCGTEFKRHSKSIDPSRHRCGSCKNQLKQIKPVPRGGAKPSDYQVFMKKQMKVVKTKNPGSPQKEIMRMVAEEWAKQPKAKGVMSVEDSEEQDDDAELEKFLPVVKGIGEAHAEGLPVSQIVDLTLETN